VIASVRISPPAGGLRGSWVDTVGLLNLEGPAGT
jgi:hypothetical protein